MVTSKSGSSRKSQRAEKLAALRTAIMAPVGAKNTVSQVQRYFEPPADDGKVLAKRFARGGIRTRDLQHGAVGAAYHYTTLILSAHGQRRTKIRILKQQKDADCRELSEEIKIIRFG